MRVVQPVNWLVDQSDVNKQLVNRSTFELEQEPEDEPGHDQRQQPRDDDERAPQCPPREPEGKQQGEGKADYELADERPEGELEGVDNGGPACGVIKDEAVVCEPGERGGDIGDRRRRGLLEAQHHVVDNGKGERKEHVQDGRREEQPGRDLLATPEREPPGLSDP